ncbi:ComEA family DNA-binding protein [Thauera sp. Sel9]|uniref:ComEA family DNA-binding protein n=1 Tax=Thauera sp. Sel9 TaxID=2974299 RepID=UPI0021E193CF|nr:helix-hairpin-helix domain-containing protein [Thauera sp. Sel9]MCV2216956.1 helix-hairpin-helix domain-containing protein [Thauera sp. Sel9]
MSFTDAQFAPATPAAQLGHSHGYAFDGDQVSLRADIRILDPMAAAERNWALQLWAGETLIANAGCGALWADASGNTSVEITVAAMLPAGTSEHALNLALACDDGSGLQRCDSTGYPRSERFCLPRIDGSVGYTLAEGHTAIHADGISNPRAAGSLSGSLVLELWALPELYRGGAFTGILVGSTGLGCIAGQYATDAVDTELPACSLPAGRWHLTLMLREWTSNGYVTRDYRTFSLPVDGPLPAPATTEKTAVEIAAATAEASTDAAPEAAASTESDTETPVAPAEPAAAPAEASKTSRRTPARAAKAAKQAPASAQISINDADAATLASLKGVTAAIAKGIVAGRPWKSVDELIEVKGIGARLLDKLRSQLRA